MAHRLHRHNLIIDKQITEWMLNYVSVRYTLPNDPTRWLASLWPKALRSLPVIAPCGVQSDLVNPCFFNSYASQYEHSSW